MARWMALDVGSKNIGIAITDPLKVTVRPLKTLRRRNLAEDVRRLGRLMEEQEIQKLIVGRPQHLGGEKSAILNAIEPLVEALREIAMVPIEWAEERLSSKEADKLMTKMGLSVEEKRRRKNEFSAALILEWYLQECGG